MPRINAEIHWVYVNSCPEQAADLVVAPKNALISGTSSERVSGYVLKDIVELNKKAASEFKSLSIEVNPAYLDTLPGTKKAAAFVVKPDGTAIIYLRENPTYYEWAHELAHGYHYKSIGGTHEAWKKISDIEKEVKVFQALHQTKIWDRLTPGERQNAINVMKKYLDDFLSARGTPRSPIYQAARIELQAAEKRIGIPTIPIEE